MSENLKVTSDFAYRVFEIDIKKTVGNYQYKVEIKEEDEDEANVATIQCRKLTVKKYWK